MYIQFTSCAQGEGVLKKIRNTHRESLFNKGLEKETLTQLLSCKYCEMFKNTYFEEHLRTAASDKGRFSNLFLQRLICDPAKHL